MPNMVDGPRQLNRQYPGELRGIKTAFGRLPRDKTGSGREGEDNRCPDTDVKV